MNEMERELATMMKQRVEDVASRADGVRTLRRARRRRAATALTAATLALVVVGGGVGAVRALDREPRSRAAGQPATQAPDGGAFAFSSTPGEYPYVAAGRFHGDAWELRGAAVNLERDAEVRLTLLTGRRSYQTRAYVRGDEPLFVRYQPWVYVPGRDAAAVFGATAPEVETVEIVFDVEGEPIRAHMFNGHDDRSTITVDYFVAFVPPDARGEVIARDASGDVVATDVIPPRGAEGRSWR